MHRRKGMSGVREGEISLSVLGGGAGVRWFYHEKYRDFDRIQCSVLSII